MTTFGLQFAQVAPLSDQLYATKNNHMPYTITRESLYEGESV